MVQRSLVRRNRNAIITTVMVMVAITASRSRVQHLECKAVTLQCTVTEACAGLQAIKSGQCGLASVNKTPYSNLLSLHNAIQPPWCHCSGCLKCVNSRYTICSMAASCSLSNGTRVYLVYLRQLKLGMVACKHSGMLPMYEVSKAM